MSLDTAVRGGRRWAASLAAALVGLGLLGASVASAETYPAGSTEALVAAVGKANANPGANTIVLTGGVYLPIKTLTFTNTSGAQTVEGPSGPANVTTLGAKLEGGSVEPFPSELFVVKAGVSVTFKNVGIGHGGGSGVSAIEDFGTLDIESSAVAGNTGAGVHVEPSSTAVVRNSTFSDGLDFGLVNSGTASFFNSTVAFNKNGGVENQATLNLTNTIVAENKGSGDCAGKATTSDHSLDSDGSCGVGALSEMNPLLQTGLANDGGSTPVHSLKPTSPAIEAGNPATCTSADQRGAPRPGIAGKPCDIGADEYSETPPTIKVPSDITTPATGPEGANVAYIAEATGSNAVARLSCTMEAGSLFPIGTTTVECTAKDGHENTAKATFKVTVSPLVTVVAPTAETKAASSITQTGATLNATVNPNSGEVTECKFEYATAAVFELTGTYSSSIPCSALPGAGTSPVAVSAPITGLTANTTYHFRIVAMNSGGPGKGTDETFKTLPEVVTPLAPTAETNAASAVGQTGATLNAMVNPNGFEVTECEFEYGTTNLYGKTIPCSALPGAGSSPVAVSAPITGLTANTTYHFRIVAMNSGGPGKGTDETFKTLPEVVTPLAPTAETNAASAVGQTGATLNAMVNPNGFEVTECEFEYGTTNLYGKTIPCSALPGAGSSPVAVSAPITGLTANTTYHFRIVAMNSGGPGKGTDETFKTLPEVVTPLAPTAETNAASAVGQTGATLNAMVNPNGFEVTECEFEYGTTNLYGKTIPCSALPGAGSSPVAVSAPITGLTANTTYHFRIVAMNSGGPGKGTDETFKTLPEVVTPLAPTAETNAASAVGQTGATLNAMVNPNGFEVTECEFEYGTTNLYGKTIPCSALPGAGTSPVAVSAPITGLTANTTYHFRIVAMNSGGPGKGTDETFKTLPEVVTPLAPTAETNAASAVGQTGATLNAMVNPNGFEVTECEFEYGTTNLYGKTIPCSALPGAGSSPVAVSAPITGLTANTTYHFRIVAMNSGGPGKGTDETFKTLPEVVTPLAPTAETNAASAVGQTGATLNAMVNPNGFEVTECEFEYGTTNLYGKTIPCSALPGAGSSPVAVSAPITGLTANTTYHFRIVAMNSGGPGKGTDETFKTLPEVVTPLAPTAETNAASAVGQTGATLNAMVNPNGFEVTECEFEYGTTNLYGKTIPCSALPGAGSSPVAVSAPITGLTANTTYHFRIVAMNSGGPGKGTDETFKTAEETTVVTPPAVAIAQLQQEVEASKVRHELRSELSGLLEDALGSLEGPDRGRHHHGDHGDFGDHDLAPALAPAMAVPAAWAASRHEHGDRHHGPHGEQQACQDLEQFIGLIERDQSRRKPQIPASLASAWIQSARDIEASLGCGSDDESGDSSSW